MKKIVPIHSNNPQLLGGQTSFQAIPTCRIDGEVTKIQRKNSGSAQFWVDISTEYGNIPVLIAGESSTEGIAFGADKFYFRGEKFPKVGQNVIYIVQNNEVVAVPKDYDEIVKKVVHERGYGDDEIMNFTAKDYRPCQVEYDLTFLWYGIVYFIIFFGIFLFCKFFKKFFQEK